jgi:hypothetical protein
MVIDVGTHFDLFDLLRLLALAGEVGLFLGLIFELADIKIFADWRVCIRRNLNQIEAYFSGLRNRFLGI